MALLALMTSCSVDVDIGRECPARGEACSPLPPLPASAPAPVAASPVEPLAVHVETSGLAVSHVTVTCEHPCVQVEAVAQGGQPPYRFTWDDGFDQAARLLCPGALSRIGVAVQDSSAQAAPVASSEFSPMLGATARSELDVVTTPCAPPPPTGEASTDMAVSDMQARPECDRLRLLAPPRAQAGVDCDPTIWNVLPRPVFAGRPHLVVARGSGLWQGRWRMELWGSDDGCTLSERLGEFTVLAARVNAAVPFIPRNDHAMIALVVTMNDGIGTPYLGYRLCTEE